MTTTYQGTTTGLEYDAATGTWVYKNIKQDFVDTDTFSTPDPVFPTAPTTPTTPDPTPDPCPAGYVYDEALKQCVPDPNYQNPFRQDNNQGPREEPGIPGTGKELPSKFSSEGGLFPYSTDAPTRAQQNEHMLLMDGVSKGWLVDNGQGQYIKQPFKDKQLPGIGWAGMAMKYFNEKSYDDYFKILENGWNAERDANLWTKWVPRSGGYSLVGGMKRSSTAVGGIGDDEERIVEYYGYSKGFQDKVNQAQSITGGMIDRDGNVNINADNKGGYYREDGKFVLNNGQVVSFGSLSVGLNYISKLKGSGLNLSKTLRDRLAKGINSVNFNPNMLPEGFDKDELEDILNTYKQEKQTQTDIDLGITTEETKDDGSADTEKLRVDNFIKKESDMDKIDKARIKEQDKRNEYVQKSKKSDNEAKKDYVKEQAKEIVNTPKYQQQFKKDVSPKTGKSYTQSKIEQAANTGRYSGF
jgi:hypothetical protein